MSRFVSEHERVSQRANGPTDPLSKMAAVGSSGYPDRAKQKQLARVREREDLAGAAMSVHA